MSNVFSVAREALNFYETSFNWDRLRDRKIVKHTSNAPEWVKDLTRIGHGFSNYKNTLMPDDIRFEFVVEALRLIESSEEELGTDAEEGEIQDFIVDRTEADIYNWKLTEWLNSNPGIRADYVNEAASSGLVNLENNDIFEVLATAQYLEKTEVAQLVLGFITTNLESITAEDEEVTQ